MKRIIWVIMVFLVALSVGCSSKSNKEVKMLSIENQSLESSTEMYNVHKQDKTFDVRLEYKGNYAEVPISNKALKEYIEKGKKIKSYIFEKNGTTHFVVDGYTYITTNKKPNW